MVPFAGIRLARMPTSAKTAIAISMPTLIEARSILSPWLRPAFDVQILLLVFRCVKKVQPRPIAPIAPSTIHRADSRPLRAKTQARRISTPKTTPCAVWALATFGILRQSKRTLKLSYTPVEQDGGVRVKRGRTAERLRRDRLLS